MARPEKVRLGDLLVNEKLISQQQLEQALALQAGSGRRLGRVLVENAYIREEQISEALAKQFNIPYINLKQYKLNPDKVRLLPEDQARRYRAIVLEQREDSLLVGMADPTDLSAFDEISRILKCAIDVAVVTEGQVLESIDRGYRRTDEISGQVFGRGDVSGQYPHYAAQGGEHAVASPEVSVNRQVQALFDTAIQVRASDIHVELCDKNLSSRFRIDGVLQGDIATPYKPSEGMLLRLKLMAGMDIAEKALPQVGRFPVRVGELGVSVRIATCPVKNGESVVMHLLYQDKDRSRLESLGMPDSMVKSLREVVGRGGGMVLIAGPTGSGKSTTLRAVLAEIDHAAQKIVSVENPVEYPLHGLQQIQVAEAGGLSFSGAVRAGLQLDPDVLVLSELPDAEIARFALHAALDGRLVLSCLDAYDTVSALCHLTEFGLPRFMAASSVQAVIAQRLLRRVCEHCAEIHVASTQESAWLEAEGWSAQQRGGLKHGRGCAHCHDTGYSGRIAIFEMLEMRRGMVEAAARDNVSEYLREATGQMQGKTLIVQGLDLAGQGRTTVGEVMRMCHRHQL